MLLRELDQSSNFVADLENVLNLYLKNYDKASSTGEISYEALSQWLQALGAYGAVNKRIIDQAMQQSDKLQQLISNSGEDGITLNTEAPPPEEPKTPEPDLSKTDQGISKTTQQAASSAASQSLTDN